MEKKKKPPKRSGLGLGVNSLIPTKAVEVFETSGGVESVSIHHIEPNPDQPRKRFDKGGLEELAASIEAHGIIQPLIVNELGGGFYKIVAGERRYRAARLAGLEAVPVIIKSYPEMEALQIALIENIQRQDLNPIEEAMCYQQLESYFFHNKEDIAKKVGKSRNTIAARINLLELSEAVQELVMTGTLSAGHGLKLVAVEDEAVQLKVAKEVAEKGLSLRETALLLERLKAFEVEEQPLPVLKASSFAHIESALKEIWGTKVNIKGKDEKGKIEIEYYSKEELERLVELLQK